MNKTLIALAIAAALPVAAQADMTLSGSVSTNYTDQGIVDTDAALSLSASEVLANGMTATATFDVLGDEDQGSATLTGDFGALTVGEIDSDGAFQAGDVGGAVGNTEDADEAGTTVSGIHFSTTQAGLSITAQVNGATGPTAVASTVAETRSTQFGATYDFNGVTVGYAYASADADSSDDDSTAAAKAAEATVTAGVNAAMSAFGVSYAFGDISLTAGKDSIDADTDFNVSYTTSLDGLTVTAAMDNDSEYQIDLGYALSDTLALNAEIDSDGGDTIMGVTYTSGSLTASATRTSDTTVDTSVALDFGNADLSLARNGGDAETSLTYTVAF